MLVRAAVAGIEHQRPLIMPHRRPKLAQPPIGVADIVLDVGIARVAQRRELERRDGAVPMLGGQRLFAGGEIGIEMRPSRLPNRARPWWCKSASSSVASLAIGRSDAPRTRRNLVTPVWLAERVKAASRDQRAQDCRQCDRADHGFVGTRRLRATSSTADLVVALCVITSAPGMPWLPGFPAVRYRRSSPAPRACRNARLPSGDRRPHRRHGPAPRSRGNG